MPDRSTPVPNNPSTARARWESAESLASYVDRTVANHDLWVMTHKRATLSPDHAARAAALSGQWRLLVLLEDWCGDAVNSVPVIQRVVDAIPGAELRVVERDQHLDLMDAHLTNGARAIPLAVVYDEAFAERGQWGSRPAPLQEWVRTHGRALDTDTRYKHVRTWYVRDHGQTIAEELLTLLEQAARTARPPQVAGSNSA